MKKLLVSALLLLSASGLYAASGKAIVPMTGYARYNSTASADTSIFITNITAHAIQVTVTFYGKDGSILPTSVQTFDNWTASNTQIAAKTTAYVVLQTSTVTAPNFGHAVIEWTNVGSDDDAVALVAHGNYEDYYSATSAARVAIPINNGIPF